jgi:Ca2+-binding EF-hand superfamily protein
MKLLKVSHFASLIGACWFSLLPQITQASAVEDPSGDDPPVATKTGDDAKPRAPDVKSSAASDAALAVALLGSLTPDHMKQFGLMLEQDWRKRPEWGDMAIAILKGERMRVGMGWWQLGLKRYDWSWLRAQFDANQDGLIDRDELPEHVSLGDKWFMRLDRDLDGKLSAADFEGADSTASAGPAGMLNMMSNVLFSRLDMDSNGRISLDELAEFFAKSDSASLGFLTPEDLRAGLDDLEMRKQPARGQGGEPPAAEMLRMFLTGQLGWLEAGPGYGEVAPDFTLPTHDGTGTVTLSDSRGKKPVVLIFGSFT